MHTARRDPGRIYAVRLPVHIFRGRKIFPKYVVISFEKLESDDIAADDELMAISRNLIQKNREAYEVLAR